FTPGPSGIAYFAHLGGALFGYLYLKFLPRRGLSYATSEKYFGIRNSYYRWKRRRAARKFEVYMRNHDRADYFDEHGNYRGPETKVPDKKNGESKSPWVKRPAVLVKEFFERGNNCLRQIWRHAFLCSKPQIVSRAGNRQQAGLRRNEL